MTDVLIRWAAMVGRCAVLIVAFSGWTLGAAAAEADGGSAPAKEAVNQVVKAHLAGIKYCYEKQLQKNAALEGTVRVAWDIEKDGQVTGARIVESTMNDEAVEGCILRQVRQWRFPAAAERTVVGSYPFIFKSKASPAKPGLREAVGTDGKAPP